MQTERDQIAAMRLYTEMTGLVTEVQSKSVAAWPRIMLKNLKSHTTNLNLDTREVEYVLKVKTGKKLEGLQNLKMVEESVWALLGDTWRTSFKASGRILYAGARRKEIRSDTGINSFGEGRGSFDPGGNGSVP